MYPRPRFFTFTRTEFTELILHKLLSMHQTMLVVHLLQNVVGSGIAMSITQY